MLLYTFEITNVESHHHEFKLPLTGHDELKFHNLMTLPFLVVGKHCFAGCNLVVEQTERHTGSIYREETPRKDFETVCAAYIHTQSSVLTNFEVFLKGRLLPEWLFLCALVCV
jgi:hypothetical protein